MYFDEKGKLKNFKYTTETRYNQVGNLATQILHDLLTTRYNFSKIQLPETAVSVWGSHGYAEAKVLCVIVHGAGAVRAGMWARKLLLNDSMESGTCLPWIENLLALKYGVLLLSPNDNVYHVPSKSLHCNKLGRPKAGQRQLQYQCYQPKDGGPPIPVPGGAQNRDKLVFMKGSETPQRHVLYCWENIIMATESFRRKSVLVACHSWGGVAVMSLLRHRKLGPRARDSICAVAFLDSVHRHPEPADLSRLLFVCSKRDGNEQRDEHRKGKTQTDVFLETKSKGWIKSNQPLDRSLRTGRYEQGTPYVSAGTNDHDRVPCFSRSSVLQFFKSHLDLDEKLDS